MSLANKQMTMTKIRLDWVVYLEPGRPPGGCEIGAETGMMKDSGEEIYGLVGETGTVFPSQRKLGVAANKIENQSG